jgi:hypothetical protein
MSVVKVVFGGVFALVAIGIIVAMLVLNQTLWLIVPAVVALVVGYDLIENP